MSDRISRDALGRELLIELRSALVRMQRFEELSRDKQVDTIRIAIMHLRYALAEIEAALQ